MDVIEDRVAGAPLAALRALRQANQHLDLSIYLVGGSVRDLLLERPIKDLDFAVEGDAPSLAGRLAQELGGRVVLHRRFGTASVYFGDERVDLATARREHYDRPAALPRVTPAPIDEDLARRDFSINAMALPLAAHRTSLVDPFHGQEDLELGLVRVLHPQSFVDDPTRILRAVRYEQRLGLIIEKETLGHLDRAVAAGGIAALSGDRIRNELDPDFPGIKAGVAPGAGAGFGSIGRGASGPGDRKHRTRVPGTGTAAGFLRRLYWRACLALRHGLPDG